MAGLFDRIGSGDNVQSHYFVAGLKGYEAGLWTRAQVLSGVNQLMVAPLDTSQQDDFAAIADVLDGKSNVTSRLRYVNQVEAAMTAAESGVINEAGWRAALEIS